MSLRQLLRARWPKPPTFFPALTTCGCASASPPPWARPNRRLRVAPHRAALALRCARGQLRPPAPSRDGDREDGRGLARPAPLNSRARASERPTPVLQRHRHALRQRAKKRSARPSCALNALPSLAASLPPAGERAARTTAAACARSGKRHRAVQQTAKTRTREHPAIQFFSRHTICCLHAQWRRPGSHRRNALRGRGGMRALSSECRHAKATNGRVLCAAMINLRCACVCRKAHALPSLVYLCVCLSSTPHSHFPRHARCAIVATASARGFHV